MGIWSLLNIRHWDSKRDGQVFGNYMPVVFRLKYTPSIIGGFVEMPKLEWKEVITLLDHAAGEYWVYIGDQYARNVASPTFGTWTYRYILAYTSTTQGAPYDENRAPSILMDKHGVQVRRDALPKVNSAAEQADAVRNYLKRNGGIMDVTVRDSPGVNAPKQDVHVDKERLLTFDCGLKGIGQRVYAWQYLVVSSTLTQGEWTRQFQWNASFPGVKTTGLRRVPAPDDVSVFKPAQLSPGLYA